jgi:hypothetical protein
MELNTLFVLYSKYLRVGGLRVAEIMGKTVCLVVDGRGSKLGRNGTSVAIVRSYIRLSISSVLSNCP